MDFSLQKDGSLLLALQWNRCGFSPHSLCSPFKLEVWSHIAVKSIVALQSTQLQYFVHGGRAAAKAGFRGAGKHSGASLHFGTQVDVIICLWSHRNRVGMGHWKAQTGRVTIWPWALSPKNPGLKKHQKAMEVEHQVSANVLMCQENLRRLFSQHIGAWPVSRSHQQSSLP